MYKKILPFLPVAGDAFAHPGHGAPLVHAHPFDYLRWALVGLIIVIAGIAAWRAK